MTLIIVESPTKARTFNRILKASKDKKDYLVFATMGHFRDLPSDKIALDYAHSFKPDYQIISTKQKMVDELKKLAKQNSEIIFATDPDREGEAISYHAAYVLGFIDEKWPYFEYLDKIKPKRIVFHEITSQALEDALKNPQTIRIPLVKAQQARRILDRIVGYELSPLLWKKMGKRWLSAGRVQTIALRLIVEREIEIEGFKTENFCQVKGLFDSDSKTLDAALTHYHGNPVEISTTIQLFAGEYTYTKTNIDEKSAECIKQELETDTYKIEDIREQQLTRFPPPPFTTSLLQQDAFYKFGFSSKMTMKLAQDLYEHGLITYHRTDSFNLSTHFVFRAKDFITEEYGSKYALEKPRAYRTKSRMAQEAHEAIRPTKLLKSITGTKKKRSKSLTVNHQKLYTLIFNRSVATQMKEASVTSYLLQISGEKKNVFDATLFHVTFDGFLRILQPKYVEEHSSIIDYKKGSKIALKHLDMLFSQTKHPPRYNEASLIKILEEKGIGRPSTYAPILSLIQMKFYVDKEMRYLKPTKLGFAISDYLSKSFEDLFNLNFTVQMEDNLDRIADDQEDFISVLQSFNDRFQKELAERKKDTSIINVEEEINEDCPKCGSKLTVRYSRFGKFLACSNYPTCKFTKSLLRTVKGKKCPLCEGDIVVRFTKSHKRFYGCNNYPKCKFSAWTMAQISSKE